MSTTELNLFEKFAGVAATSLVALPVMAVFAMTPVNADEDDDEAEKDFGLMVEKQLEAKSMKLFGIKKPLAESAPKTYGDYRILEQPASAQVALAKGLKAEYLTRDAGNKTDMFAFWPSEANATHLISCVEGGREEIATGKLNPSVQRINLETGDVATVLRGMSRCDGIRLTAWGTVLATEETSDGGAYEILDPMAITNTTLVTRATSDVVDANGAPVVGQVAYRGALPTMAWEGLTVLENGVVIAGDELRPGSWGPDTDGGAIFKFVPATPRIGNTPVNDLSESPLVAGSVYAMQVACKGPGSQWGQGCEIGNARWVSVNAATARVDANNNGATGYYRPEDLHRDMMYSGDGVRFCWANTGRESAYNYGEVVCAVDLNPVDAGSTVIANRFVEGDTDFNSVDNLAFQPLSGNLYVIEDHKNGDVFACLPDGADRDIKSDGCIKILSVKDSSAEPTGFMFSADGKTAYVAIQHSRDGLMPQVDDYATDDVLKISGFKLPH